MRAKGPINTVSIGPSLGFAVWSWQDWHHARTVLAGCIVTHRSDPAKKGGGLASARIFRVFLVDDDAIVRRALRELVQSDADLEVVGQAAGVNQALTQVPLCHPRCGAARRPAP